MDSPWKADKGQTGKKEHIRLSHLCQIAKGVWLEMADYLLGLAIAQFCSI
jgi:hypothetical protein